MDDREEPIQPTQPDERGYEPPAAQDVDTDITPAVTAAGTNPNSQT